MVDVQVRAQHDVNGLGRKAGRGQVLEKRRVHHVEGLTAPAVLVVADAGVDEKRQAGGLDHEAVDALEEPALVVEKVRREPAPVTLHRLRRRIGQEPGRARGTGALDDSDDGQSAELDGMHGETLGERVQSVNRLRRGRRGGVTSAGLAR